MENNKHTPGPWLFDRDSWTIRSRVWGRSDQMGDYRGCIVADFTEAHGGRKHAFDETTANAQLISAAPDMLVALEEARLVLEEVSQGSCLVSVLNAIKKAKGEANGN